MPLRVADAQDQEQEQEHAARGVCGRDESCGAVETAVGTDCAVLPKGRSSGSSALRRGNTVAHPLFVAVGCLE